MRELHLRVAELELVVRELHLSGVELELLGSELHLRAAELELVVWNSICGWLSWSCLIRNSI